MFSSESPMGEKAVLVELVEVISDKKLITECLNSHFVNINGSLSIDPKFKDIGIDICWDEKIHRAIESI